MDRVMVLDAGGFGLWGLILLFLVAGLCGALGQAISGVSSGGCLASIALGFIGALVGMWLARVIGLPELLTISIGGDQPHRAVPSVRGPCRCGQDGIVGRSSAGPPTYQVLLTGRWLRIGVTVFDCLLAWSRLGRRKIRRRRTAAIARTNANTAGGITVRLAR